MKFYKSLPLLLLCLCFSSITVCAQKTWEKPSEKWSKEDVLKVISTSPWAQTYQNTDATASAQAQQIGRNQRDTANSGGNGANAGSTNRNLGPAPVVIRLHSALPVRQAINRGRQLGVNYDKMDDKKKAEFDESSKGFLSCAICQNYYVISLTQFPDSRGQSVEEGIFQRLTLKDFKDNVWLINDKGEKRELVQFTPPKGAGDSAYFFFARKDDKGNLFLTPGNKEFKFVFNGSFLNSSNPYAIYVPRNFEFNVAKMMMGEKVEF